MYHRVNDQKGFSNSIFWSFPEIDAKKKAQHKGDRKLMGKLYFMLLLKSLQIVISYVFTKINKYKFQMMKKIEITQ